MVELVGTPTGAATKLKKGIVMVRKFGFNLIVAVENKHYIVEFSDGSAELFNNWDDAVRAGDFDNEELDSMEHSGNQRC